MGKQWEIRKEHLRGHVETGHKLYDDKAFNDLYDQLQHIEEKFKHLEAVKTLARKVVEETANIIEHDKRWTWIKVRSEYSNHEDNIKITIVHNGDFFDPDAQGISNVMGSTGTFTNYDRKMERGNNQDPPNEPIIKIRIKIRY